MAIRDLTSTWDRSLTRPSFLRPCEGEISNLMDLVASGIAVETIPPTIRERHSRRITRR